MYFHVSLLMLSWYFNLLITLKRGISWLFLTNKWLDFFSVCFHFSSSHMPVICSLFLDVRNIKHGTYTCLLLCSLSVTSSAFHHSRVCKRQDSQVQMIQSSLESLWAPSQLVPSTALKSHSTQHRSLNSSNNNKILECLPNPTHFWPSKCHLLFLVRCFLEIFARIITTRVLAA